MTRFVMLLFVALATMSAQAAKQEPAESEEPTYEQTRKWIVSKIGEGGYTHKTHISQESASYEKISMDDCSLQYTLTEFNATSVEWPSGIHTDESTTKWESTIPLEKIGESDITVKHVVSQQLGWDEWRVSINSRVGTLKMTRAERGVVGEEIKNYSNMGGDITFGMSPSTDESVANRMMKALNHAVSLCKRMKEKEPF